MDHPDTPTTLVIGEALIDIVKELDGSVAEHVGGSPLNVAVGLARLGHRVEFSTHIGPDAHGRLIDGLLVGEHVSLTSASTDLRRTATAEATLSESGAATYIFDIEWPAIHGLPNDVGHVHTGSIGAALKPGDTSVFEALRSMHGHATTSFDPNVRPTLMSSADEERARVERFLEFVDVVKSSDEDAEWLYPGQAVEGIAKHWATLGPALVIITRGGDGAHVLLPHSGETFELAGRKVDVADTVGAGDSFMSGMISGLLDDGLLGGPAQRETLKTASPEVVRPALERAIWTSSITVTRHGSQPPHRSELS